MSICEEFTVHELLALQEQGAILTDAEARRVDAWRAQQRAQAALDDDGA